MDALLATHFAHLFIRDPIVVFSEDLQELDLQKTDHFENLQSTNWQHMRFKPPPAPKPRKDNGDDANNNHEREGDAHDQQNEPGWRVEFRSMEIQMTDFENAAFAIFIVLITRVILSFDLNLYLPIPRTTENMETAHRRDAVLEDRFYFRKDPFPPRRPARGTPSSSRAGSRAGTPAPPQHRNGTHVAPAQRILQENHVRSASPLGVRDEPSAHFGPVEDEYTLMTIDEIINGTPSASGAHSFPGLVPLVESYLDSVNVDIETRCALARYLDVVRKRASGELITGAKWIRGFVRSHEEYKGDSVVGEGITYDLCRIVEGLGRDVREEGVGIEKFLGKK